ncbi:MAG TPA: DoxX protein [Hanamia sp.]|nr:DoxX protein [Hanamia sp.]
MKNIIILLLRIALGIGFLSAVADRFGFWGAPGEAAVAWGNWENFIQYVGKLNFGASGTIANVLGIIGTILEIAFGILLIIGFKLKSIAFFSGILLLVFALEMSINTHLKSALDASVFSASFGAFLLSIQPIGRWSIDYLLQKK